MDASRFFHTLHQEPARAGISARNASELPRLMNAVTRTFSALECKAPDAFRPAHLSVALVDAVFTLPPANGYPLEAVAERYCRSFGLARLNPDHWNLPPVDAQEPLGDFIERYERLGARTMEDKVFATRCRVPGTGLSRVRCVAGAAAMLQRIGVDVLQDVHTHPPWAIRGALSAVPGDAEGLARRFLTFTGGDDFVLADGPVHEFVAGAVGRSTVSQAEAAALVRSCAYELLLSPRYLDARICGDIA